MNCYKMKAQTHNGDWVEFTLHDLPTPISKDEFILLAKPNTPRVLLNTIRRGDPDTNLYEGDVIECDGSKWLICYERGFYAINNDYVSKYLYTIRNFTFLGTNLDIPMEVQNSLRTKYLFKYDKSVFRLQDIVGGYQGKLLLRFASEPVDPDDIQQECCLTYNGTRVYLGDVFDEGTVKLHFGRVTLDSDNGLYDIITGGTLWT